MLTRLHTQGTTHGSKTQIPSSVRTPTPQPPDDNMVVSNKDAVAVIKSNTFMPGANMQKQLDHVSLSPLSVLSVHLASPLPSFWKTKMAGRRGVLPVSGKSASSCVFPLVSMRTMIAAFQSRRKHGAAARHMVYMWASSCQWFD